MVHLRRTPPPPPSPKSISIDMASIPLRVQRSPRLLFPLRDSMVYFYLFIFFEKFSERKFDSILITNYIWWELCIDFTIRFGIIN